MRTISLITLFFFVSCEDYNSRFDLRKKAKVTPARQQSWGTCWAFASLSSMESAILIERKFKEQDLAEYYLDKFNGFNRNGRVGDRKKGWYSGHGPTFKGSNKDDPEKGLVVHLGGDYRMVAAALSNFRGVVSEELVPKIGSEHQDHEAFENITFDHPDYQFYYPSEVQWPLIGLDAVDRIKTIKTMIRRYGAVASAQYQNEKPLAIHDDGLEVHMNLSEPKINHAVSIIGWNDHVQYGNHKGAWLVKDSDHRDEKTGKHIGHFYIMYDDLHAAKDELMGAVYFAGIEKRKKGSRIYSHALHGWRKEINVERSSVRYRIKGEEKLDRVGFYVLLPNVNYSVSLTVNDKVVSKQMKRSRFAGFYSLELAKKNKLKPGDTVEIILEYPGPHAYDAPFSMDVLMGALPPWGEPVFVNSKSKPGESFYGRYGKIEDLYYKVKDGSFAINLYTQKR